ncbi:MAG: hypothetical protein ACP5O1_06555 [Phycisphaerae bacterium]
MADERVEITTGARLWPISNRYPARRAVIEKDHLMLLTGSGYRDNIRRILFNRVERICVSTGRRFGWRVWLALFLLTVDVLVFAAVADTSIGFEIKMLFMLLIGWPIPVLVYWLVFSLLNPIHQMYIVRAGRTHEIKVTLSYTKFSAFYAELCRRIREFQSQFSSAGQAVAENSAIASPETSGIEVQAGESAEGEAPQPPTEIPPASSSLEPEPETPPDASV